jgi:hypothetical protein
LKNDKTRSGRRLDGLNVDLIGKFFTYKKLARALSHGLIIAGAISFFRAVK